MKTNSVVDISSQFNPSYEMFNNTVLKKMLHYDPNMRPTIEDI